MTATDDRREATMRLPNTLAYAVAAVAVASTLLLPFTVTRNQSLSDAVAGYYLQSAALFGVLGVLILRRRPGHLIGWLLVAIAAFDAITRLVDQYEVLGLVDQPGFPALATMDRWFGWMWAPAVAGIVVALPQLFPSGHLLSPRWRPLAWFGAAASGLLSVLFLVEPDGETWWTAVAFPVFGLSALTSLAPLVLRYRRSTGAERQQLKWAFYGLAVSVPLLILGTAGTFIAGPLFAFWVIPPLVIIPVTITVAVLRYRLYDIDVVISRTLLVAGLAAFITAAYVGIVVGVGSLVGRGDEPNLALSVGATALVAVAFQPVRRGLQRVANRLVFGRRATPYDVLSGFATRVGAAEASPDTLTHLAELVAGGTGANPARVWLRVGSQLRPEATWPPAPPDGPGPAAVQIDVTVDGDVDVDDGVDNPVEVRGLPDADLGVPVRERGELLGVLTIAKPRGERVTEVDVDLVERLAAASGVLLRNLRLDAELTQRLADLEASRRRLVSAQDDARRRIEAELAGGSRAQLGALRERLSELAGDVDPETTPKTASLLAQLVTSTDGALQTLAGLAAGVYPPRLAADGLAVALSEQAVKAAVPVIVQAAGVGRHPAEVEAAVYFAVLEALQNVAKYAEATSAQVRLRHEGDRLSFEVTDDGVGFDPATTRLGTGLQGITDRLDTVGGTMTLESALGRGTTITGQIPGAPGAPTSPARPALAGAAR